MMMSKQVVFSFAGEREGSLRMFSKWVLWLLCISTVMIPLEITHLCFYPHNANLQAVILSWGCSDLNWQSIRQPHTVTREEMILL